MNLSSHLTQRTLRLPPPVTRNLTVAAPRPALPSRSVDGIRRDAGAEHGGGRPQVEMLVDVETEGAARVDVGPEQRGQATPVLSLSFFAHTGSASTCWTSKVFTYTSADWSRRKASIEVSAQSSTAWTRRGSCGAAGLGQLVAGEDGAHGAAGRLRPVIGQTDRSCACAWSGHGSHRPRPSSSLAPLPVPLRDIAPMDAGSVRHSLYVQKATTCWRATQRGRRRFRPAARPERQPGCPPGRF
jgi:hypothetical protein